MIELQVKGTQSFMSKEIPVIEGGFGEGKKSMLVREISAIHRIKVGNINQRINDNREKFEDGVDIIDLKTDTSAVSVLKELGFTQAQIGNSNNIYLLSERGYAKLIKIMDTALAWEIYNRLIDEYFTMRKIITSKMDSYMIEDPVARAMRWIEEYKERQLIEEQKKLIEEKHDNLVHTSKTYTTTEIAKELGFKSANALNKDLESKKLQYKMNGTWVLAAKFSEKGFVSIKQNELKDGRIIYYRRWTGKGRDWLVNDIYKK